MPAKDVEMNPPQVHCTARGHMKMSTSAGQPW